MGLLYLAQFYVHCKLKTHLEVIFFLEEGLQIVNGSFFNLELLSCSQLLLGQRWCNMTCGMEK